MANRINEEVALMRARYPDLEHFGSGNWVRIPGFRLPGGWSRAEISLVFQFPTSNFPQAAFYGFYVPSGLRFGTAIPKNFTDPSPAHPPLAGAWAFFSGHPDPWNPSPQIEKGSNGLSWLHSIYARFLQGIGDD
jgi:hypothetical protein